MRKAVKEKLESLQLTDVYSLILFAIYKIKDIPEYSTLSELAYLLNKDSLFNLLEYYGGTTIRIPTLKEFKTVIEALLLYQLVELEKMDANTAIKALDTSEVSLKDIRECYAKIAAVLVNYEFKRNWYVQRNFV